MMINIGMRNLILVSAITVLVAAGSAKAQNPIGYLGPPFRENPSIEDDTTGSSLVFDRRSGAYTFTRCSDGLKIAGVGVVKVDGCLVSLEGTQPDHRVAASVNECAQEAKAVIETFTPGISPNGGQAPLGFTPFKAFLLDSNMGNNLMDCAPKK
jgi:hypothetical protein